MQTAFQKLDVGLQQKLLMRVCIRQIFFMSGYSADQVLLIGDRPAPSAPDDPSFHYTPFAALSNSSLWLNLQLEKADIPEQVLSWVNSADFRGNETNPQVLKRAWQLVIALGGNAEGWARKHGVITVKVQHPAAWKRFHSKEPYPLVDILKEYRVAAAV